jgi:hypothetical protein
MRWHSPRPGFSFRTVEAQPDDPMFGRMHIAFFNLPEEPASSTPEAEKPERRGKARFMGLRPVDPDSAWTIHMRPRPGSGEQA